MDTASIRTLNIVGCGKLGMTLGRLWHEAGVFSIQDILNRSPESAEQAASFIGAGKATRGWSDLHPADVWLIATPDGQIAEAAQRLADSVALGQSDIVFHCSGALPSDVLAPAVLHGAHVASTHPIRSFADPAHAAAAFTGTYCGMEGSEAACDVLNPAFKAVGARPVPIEAEHKTVYHAAAVFASNYLVTLLDVAAQAYRKAGVPQDMTLRMMEPLVRGTLDNIFQLGPEDALTGPIARGDIATVVKQYRAVTAWDDRFGALYKQMGKLTADLAARRATSPKNKS